MHDKVSVLVTEPRHGMHWGLEGGKGKIRNDINYLSAAVIEAHLPRQSSVKPPITTTDVSTSSWAPSIVFESFGFSNRSQCLDQIFFRFSI